MSKDSIVLSFTFYFFRVQYLCNNKLHKRIAYEKKNFYFTRNFCLENYLSINIEKVNLIMM